MPIRKARTAENRQWHSLLVYNLYRFLSVFLFISIYYYTPKVSHPELFFCILAVYFTCILVFMYCGYNRTIRFDKQVIISGVIDIVALSFMLNLICSMRSGQGILLNVTIAALSILVPGRLTVFFAALASCLLLAGNVVQLIVYNEQDLANFYYSGIYGAGFFATALTAWYLANWVRQSEDLAQRHSNELINMQRINEYIIERLHSGIIYVDENKNILLMNSAARVVFGLSQTHQSLQLEQLSPLLVEKFEQFLLKTQKKELVAQAVIDDLLRIHFFSISVCNKYAVLITLEDMISIAQQAQQLKLASLGRFSASIAHELRNPLGAIAHAAQLLGEEHSLNKDDERLKELIINNCNRMNGVIKNVLQLSRREKAKPEMNDIGFLLTQFKQDFYHKNSCNLIIKVPQERLFLFFDKSQLEQVLVILCDNSIIHAQDKRGIAHITISANAIANKSSIIISDLGPGIPPEYYDTVFEPFFTTLNKGTGMGLFIARDLCEINQARLDVLKVDKGCAFSITQNLSDELLL